MTTQPEEAVGNEANAPEPTPEERLSAALGVEDAQEEEEVPAEGEAPVEDELTPEEEADDLPPIDAPVSWDAEAKAKFAELPRDVQEYVSKREGEREKFVQQKSQEATRARTEAEQAALQQVAAYEAQVAQHFQSLAEQVLPQRPNPALLQHDPQAFYAQQAQYEQAAAQQRELQQNAQQYAQQAQVRAAQIEQHNNAEQHRIIVENFPEYADPTTGPELQRKLSAVAKRIGYSDELIGQARAQDIIAMREVSNAFEKADKYDALMKAKMEKVRSAKELPKVTKPGSAPAPGAAKNAQYALDREAMRRGDKDATARVLSQIINN